jgi:hypothetical protein
VATRRAAVNSINPHRRAAEPFYLPIFNSLSGSRRLTCDEKFDNCGIRTHEETPRQLECRAFNHSAKLSGGPQHGDPCILSRDNQHEAHTITFSENGNCGRGRLCSNGSRSDHEVLALIEKKTAASEKHAILRLLTLLADARFAPQLLLGLPGDPFGDALFPFNLILGPPLS